MTALVLVFVSLFQMPMIVIGHMARHPRIVCEGIDGYTYGRRAFLEIPHCWDPDSNFETTGAVVEISR